MTFLLTHMARGGPAVKGFRVLDSLDAAKEYAQRRFGGYPCKIWQVFPDKEPVLRSIQKYKKVNGIGRPLEWKDQ